MKKYLKLLPIALPVALFFLTVIPSTVHAEYWFKNASQSLVTNDGTGLANADIHVRNCYIGLGTGTPCGGGGGGSISGTIAAKQIAWGDSLDTIAGSSYFQYSDTTQNLLLTNSASETWFEVAPDVADGSLVRFGDLARSINGTAFEMSDANQNTSFFDAYGYMFTLDRATGTYGFGDLDGSINASLISIDDSGRTISMQAGRALAYGDTSGNSFLAISPSSSRYGYGDLSSINGGTYESFNDEIKNYGVFGAISTLGATTFVGSGLDDATIEGNYTKTDSPNFTLTITHNDAQLINLSSVSTPGAFEVGDTIEGVPGGTTATVVKVSGDTYIWAVITGGPAFSTEPTITNTTVGPRFGNTGSVFFYSALSDLATFTDGTTVEDFNLLTMPATINGVSYSVGADTGHTIGDYWECAVTTVVDTQGVSIDFLGDTYTIGRADGVTLDAANGKGGIARIGDTNFSVLRVSRASTATPILNFLDNSTGNSFLQADTLNGYYFFGAPAGFGNATSIEINDLTQLITVTNVPTYADDATAAGAGLTTGQLYKTTTLGVTSLNIVP